MLSLPDVALLGVGGVIAGTIGTGGGITSLVSYPALLAIGLAPIEASVTNIVALVACLPGSALSSGPELQGRSPALRRFLPAAVLGGGAGAALLLATSSTVFDVVVPFLLLAGTLVLLAEPALSARRREDGEPGALVAPGIFATAFYNGYFGAGSGVMTLALLLLTVDRHVARANALKNVLVGAATAVAAIIYVCFGHVDFVAALVLGLGLFAGSTLGPTLARRLPGAVLRAAALAAGFGLAGWLFAHPGR